MQLTLVNILTIFILFQLLLLILFLLTSKRGKRISNTLLALFFFLLLINVIDGAIAYTGLYGRYPTLAHLEDGFVFLLGPVLYFYTLSLIYRNFEIKRNYILHLAPFVLFTVSYLLFYHTRSPEYQHKIQAAIFNRDLPAGFYVSIIVVYAHVTCYIALALNEIQLYRTRIKDHFSSVEKINLEWLGFMLGSVAFVIFVSLIYTFLPVVGLTKYFDVLFAVTFVLLFVFVIGVVWKGMRHPELFAGIEQADQSMVKKYLATLKPDEKEKIQAVLTSLMQNDKLFLDADLTLEKLAERTAFPAKKISQVINDAFQQNFFEFVNKYRIEEAERLFKENRDKKLTVLEVMYGCGFNSKSSFNTIFKEKTGLTPSAYKRLNLPQ